MWKFLAAAAGPLVRKALIMLGIGFVSYEAVNLSFGLIVSQMQTVWGTTPESILQIASLGGIPQSFGIIMGALSARLSYVAVQRIAKLAS